MDRSICSTPPNTPASSLSPASSHSSSSGGDQEPIEQGQPSGFFLGTSVVRPHADAPNDRSMVQDDSRYAQESGEAPFAVVLCDRTSTVVPATASTSQSRKRKQPEAGEVDAQAAMQAAANKITISEAPEGDLISQLVSENKKARLSATPEFLYSEFDVFIAGGPFPNLSFFEKMGLTIDNRLLESTQKIMAREYGEYRLAACPYVVAGGGHTAYLVAAKDVPTYLNISGLWLRLRRAVDTGQVVEAMQARDQFKEYLNDPQTLHMSRPESVKFKEEKSEQFVEPEALEQLFGAQLDYFIRTHADDQQRPRVGFTLLNLQDSLPAMVNSLVTIAPVCLESGEDAQVFHQVGTTRLVIRDKNPGRIQTAICHLSELISRLLAQDYEQAKVSQQALQDYQGVFQMESMLAALEEI